MDMKIDSTLVKSEREKRAWSQEHLSKVSGLGLRTIQRVEKTGLASYESAQALASVFAIDVADLRCRVSTENRIRNYVSSRAALGAMSAVIVMAVGSLFFARASIADQIMLDVDVSRADTSNGDEIREIGRLLIAEGKIAEMRIDNVLRLTVSPMVQEDGKVLLTAQVFEYLVDEYVLLAEPKLITANKKEAEIRVTSDSGKTFRFFITPHAN